MELNGCRFNIYFLNRGTDLRDWWHIDSIVNFDDSKILSIIDTNHLF